MVGALEKRGWRIAVYGGANFGHHHAHLHDSPNLGIVYLISADPLLAAHIGDVHDHLYDLSWGRGMLAGFRRQIRRPQCCCDRSAYPEGVASDLEEICGHAYLLLPEHLLPHLLDLLL